MVLHCSSKELFWINSDPFCFAYYSMFRMVMSLFCTFSGQTEKTRRRHFSDGVLLLLLLPSPPQRIHSPANSILGRKLWKSTMTSVSVEENSFGKRNAVKNLIFLKCEIWNKLSLINRLMTIRLFIFMCLTGLLCRFRNQCLDVLLTGWLFILLIKVSCQSPF